MNVGFKVIAADLLCSHSDTDLIGSSSIDSDKHSLVHC